ncbi:LysR family substrate-binding domain-containing protein [Pseudonocardia charpentierae]|uniref:LysR family substrate-binding domain-containing protein n=1 Tax=Pseudonocardia charpentierae TaxID=3075545 RepID=A0ABU2NHM4_9PSEU|nr:LysR family substrate-binding domain-containing protein [Pseudonocardia sp. DSM 45834]MDT0353463.1 LysR family substrate-binding domain-containing protein [Pseudonocardia sp. DSM 45834]
MTEPSDAAVFRLGYVPGVTPGKWARMWAERRPHVPLELVTATTDETLKLVRTGAVDAALVRLPIDRTGLHTIPLYTETTVAVVPKDHVVTATDEATVADLADEIVLSPQDDTLTWPGDRPGRAAAFTPATTAEAIELVAAGVGLLVVPQSLARLHHRRDLTYRPLADAPGSSVGLAWPDAENTELMEEFIGIVRGRTVNSTRTPRRGETTAPGTPARTKKSVARRPPARRGTHRR